MFRTHLDILEFSLELPLGGTTCSAMGFTLDVVSIVLREGFCIVFVEILGRGRGLVS